eukprot:2458792-Rhodomonas_salina.2
MSAPGIAGRAQAGKGGYGGGSEEEEEEEEEGAGEEGEGEPDVEGLEIVTARRRTCALSAPRASAHART